MKRLGLMLALGLLVGACDSGENSSNDVVTPTQDVAGDDVASDDTVGTDVAQGECAALDLSAGAAFRVTKLLGIKPTNLVNQVWSKDISTYDLVLLVRIVAHDKAAGTMTMAITSAKAEVREEADGTLTPLGYTYALEPAQFNVRIDDCDFHIEEPISLSIMTPTVSKPFTVFNVTGSGTFLPDASAIENVKLQGAIAEEEATDLCMLVPGLADVNFHWFMNTANICPELDSNEDGTMDAYGFEGRMEAVNESDLYRDGLDPMESLVTECKVDNEPCN